jgi:hypothetical protein
VLQGNGQETFCFNPNFFFIGIDSHHLYLSRPTHLSGKIYHAQTPFFPENFPFESGNGGIDQLVDVFLRVFVIDVQDNDALKDADLIRC